MSRDRFSKLERRRRDGTDDGERSAPHAVDRFGKIEPRKPEPAAPPPDPFAPPREDTSALEIREDDRADAKRMHAERDATTRAHFVEEAAALILERERRDSLVPPKRLTLQDRLIAGGCGLVAIAGLAQIVSPILWALAPVLVLVLLAGYLAGRD